MDRKSNGKEASRMARIILRRLHPTVAPASSDVGMVSDALQLFAQERFLEASNTFFDWMQDVEEGVRE